jgi:hypothetical protein
LTQRFYFDLTNGPATIRDDEGVEASDLHEAMEEAKAVLNEMRDSADQSRRHESWTLVIRAEGGIPLTTLPLP